MAEGTVTIIVVGDVGVCALLAIIYLCWRHRRRKEPIFMDLRRRLVVKVETLRYGGARLYHQTDDATAKIILKTQQMRPGNGGVAGGGIYFATTPELTGHKAHKKGVILEATVDLGRIHTLEAAGDPSMTPERLKAKGFESVCIARPVSSGHEYVVYDPKQVLSIRWHARAASTVEPRGRDDNDLEQGNGNSLVTPAILGNSRGATPRIGMAELHARFPEISEETLATFIPALWRKMHEWLHVWAAEEAEKAASDKAAAEKAEEAATKKAAALQRFDGDAPKVDQILAKMREMGHKNFSRDDARAVLKEYGHGRSGHDRPVEKIVQMTVEAIETQMIYGC